MKHRVILLSFSCLLSLSLTQASFADLKIDKLGAAEYIKDGVPWVEPYELNDSGVVTGYVLKRGTSFIHVGRQKVTHTHHYKQVGVLASGNFKYSSYRIDGSSYGVNGKVIMNNNGIVVIIPTDHCKTPPSTLDPIKILFPDGKAENINLLHNKGFDKHHYRCTDRDNVLYIEDSGNILVSVADTFRASSPFNFYTQNAVDSNGVYRNGVSFDTNIMESFFEQRFKRKPSTDQTVEKLNLEFVEYTWRTMNPLWRAIEIRLVNKNGQMVVKAVNQEDKLSYYILVTP